MMCVLLCSKFITSYTNPCLHVHPHLKTHILALTHIYTNTHTQVLASIGGAVSYYLIPDNKKSAGDDEDRALLQVSI